MTHTSTPTLSMSLRQLAADSYDDYRQALMRSAADRLDELHTLLAEAAPHVEASAGAEHMLDGFGARKVLPVDDLLQRIRVEVAA